MSALATKILDALKARNYAPLYVLQGEEIYYIDLISDYIEAHVLTASEKGFNQIVLYGKDTDVPTVLTHARRFPVMAERQVIIVKEAQEIPDLYRGVSVKLMLNYIAHPVPSTVLVLCYKHKTLDKRTELGKKVDKANVSAVFRKLYDNQLPEFIRHYMQRKKSRIEERGVRMLCEYVGNDLKRMASEIDKMLINATGDAIITADNVMSQVGISRAYNVFELQNALIRKDVPSAYKIALYLGQNARKNPLIPIVAFLYSFYSRLLVASTIPACNEKKLIATLNVTPFVARNCVAALRHYSTDQIVRGIQHIAAADMKLKGMHAGVLREGQVLTELIYWLTAVK